MLAVILLLIGIVDDFDRLEGPALSGIAKSADATKRDHLSISDLGNLPNVLEGSRSPLIIVKTDEVNPARLLVSPALRKPPGGQGEPVPILVIEKFDTFEAGPATRRIARGRDVILFDGFRLDLDSGQVVPDGQGGDIQFLATGEGGPRLVALKPATMYTLTKSPLAKEIKANQPTSGRTIAKSDFSGLFRLYANGQTSGRLELQVEEGGAVNGRFRSDQTGGAYKVTGQAGGESANKIRLAIEFPRTRQEFDGFLFVEGKGAITGSFLLLDKPYGFFAVRDGGTLVADGEDVGKTTFDETKPGKFVIIITSKGSSMEGKPIEEAAILVAFKSALAADPSISVSIESPKNLPAATMLKLAEALRSAGATVIRLRAIQDE